MEHHRNTDQTAAQCFLEQKEVYFHCYKLTDPYEMRQTDMTNANISPKKRMSDSLFLL